MPPRVLRAARTTCGPGRNAGDTPEASCRAITRERRIGSHLIRVTEDGRGARVRLQDLGAGVTLEFETWVAAWAYVDREPARGGGAAARGDAERDGGGGGG